MKVILSQMSLRACETLNHSRSLFLYPPSFSRTLRARVATIATIAPPAAGVGRAAPGGPRQHRAVKLARLIHGMAGIR